MEKEIANQVQEVKRINQEVKRIKDRINPRINMVRHVFELTKIKFKEKILKAARRQQ